MISASNCQTPYKKLIRIMKGPIARKYWLMHNTCIFFDFFSILNSHTTHDVRSLCTQATQGSIFDFR